MDLLNLKLCCVVDLLNLKLCCVVDLLYQKLCCVVDLLYLKLSCVVPPSLSKAVSSCVQFLLYERLFHSLLMRCVVSLLLSKAALCYCNNAL